MDVRTDPHAIAALEYLSDYGSVATHFIAKHIGWREDRRRAYRMLCKLADETGMVERVTVFGSGRTYWWRISIEGRVYLSKLAATASAPQ